MCSTCIICIGINSCTCVNGKKEREKNYYNRYMKRKKLKKKIYLYI